MIKRIGIRKISEINRKYKKYNKLQLGGPILICYGHYTKNEGLENIGQILCTTTGIINYGMFYIDNYIYQLEQWREKESEYEDKKDPPKWNVKVENKEKHTITSLEFIAAVVPLWQIVILMNIMLIILRKDIISIVENCLSICEIFL